MKPATARTLIAAAIITGLIGMMVMSPTAGFWLAILAAIFAAFPSAFARKGPQITAIVILVLSIAASFMAYPAHKKSMAEYVERVKQQADKRKAAKSAPAEKAMKKDDEVVSKEMTTAPAPAQAQSSEAAPKMGYEGVGKEAEPTTK